MGAKKPMSFQKRSMANDRTFMATNTSSLNNSSIFSQTMIKRSSSRPKSPNDGWRPTSALLNRVTSVINTMAANNFTKSDNYAKPTVSHIRRKAMTNGRSLTAANSKSRTPSNPKNANKPPGIKSTANLGHQNTTITTSFKEN